MPKLAYFNLVTCSNECREALILDKAWQDQLYLIPSPNGENYLIGSDGDAATIEVARFQRVSIEEYAARMNACAYCGGRLPYGRADLIRRRFGKGWGA